jgi:hypothetical protein
MIRRSIPASLTAPRLVFTGTLLAYAIFGLVVLDPLAVYSGDIGVKFVQARGLVAQNFRSLDLPYPGALVDPDREFFPLRPPFVMTIAGETQAIFPPASALLQAAGAGAAGTRGMIFISILAAAGILLAIWRVTPERDAAIVLATLGVASPLWFYAVTGWEHAPAAAFGCAAFACALRARSAASLAVAGILLGIGAAIRDEVLLLFPGLLLAGWIRMRSARGMMLATAAVLVPLATAAVVDVQWFGRPVAAHLRHAVHLVQAAAHVTAAPNPELPELDPMTLRERYDTVIAYWLLGYGNNVLIALYSVGLAIAWIVRWRWRSSAGTLVWLAAVLALAATDVREALVAPKFLAGLFRVAPYLVFAALPPPRAARGSPLHVVAVVTTGAYLAIALAGVDTTGGKSLGPRLLLPLFPLLACAAVIRIADYLRSPDTAERRAGLAGAGLILLAATIHVVGTARAYYGRNAIDASAIRAVAASHARIVVSDDVFTAQLLLPLYFRKIVVLADSPGLGVRLGARLAGERVSEAMLVSRSDAPDVSLPPYHRTRTERIGRMTIQYWMR